MNAAIVSRTLSLIPDRVVRAQSGTAFDPKTVGACAHPERIAHLVQFLDWLGPLREVTKDDLRIFGLVTPYGKPALVSALEDEADDGELELEAGVEPELALEAVPAEEPREPALT